MYNPYTILTPRLLEALLQQPLYFVRQYYPRGLPESAEKIVPLLLTHYTHQEAEKERAERHMRLLGKDPYRFLYDSTQKPHIEKLLLAASQPKGYCIYINLLPQEWKASNVLKTKLHHYVKEKLNGWHTSSADPLKVTLKERYGHLFIALTWRRQRTEVLLEDIEQFSLCATT